MEQCEFRNANGAVQFQLYPQGQYQSGAAYFYTRDHLGSIREMTNTSGTVLARYDYDPWGRSTTVIGTNKPDFNFTGLYQHAKSGLDMAAYRFYDPDLGRWLNRDPIGEAGGLNLYGYVENDPINLWDPLGLDAIVLNDMNGAGRQGHSAVLVGNNQTGWSYYSKDGYGGGRYGDGNSRLATYPTFEQFYNSADAARYNRAVYIPTSLDQDLAMTTFGDRNYRDSYGFFRNNCSDLVNGVLGAGDIPGAGSVLGTTRPNSQYDNFSRRPGWTPFNMR